MTNEHFMEQKDYKIKIGKQDYLPKEFKKILKGSDEK